MNKRIGLVLAGVAAAAVLVGGTAYGAVSSIPDAAGVVHGCYDSGGNVKVIDTSITASCPKGYSSLDWNQTGPAGKDGKDGTNGTNGSGVVTSAGVPASACNPGDTDVDLATGEVYNCVASAGSGAGAGKAGPPGNAWSDTGSSIMGPQGPAGKDGTDGTNAAPEFTWTIPCPSGSCAGGDAQASIPDGIVLTPVAITVRAGTCSDPNTQSVLISDAGAKGLGSITWGAANSSQVDGSDTISAANGNVGPLHYIATGDCAFTITFTFDETQSYS
jgi:hypothetical protein